MTIGQLASAAGVNVETIRYYERRGLVRQPGRTNGYRRYGDEHLWRVRFVKRAQGFGFTLSEIGDLLSSEVPSDVADRARDKAAALESEIARMEERRRRLLALIEVCSSGGSGEDCLSLDLPSPTGSSHD